MEEMNSPGFDDYSGTFLLSVAGVHHDQQWGCKRDGICTLGGCIYLRSKTDLSV